MTNRNRFTLYNNQAQSIFRDKAVGPLVLTLHPHLTNNAYYFDYSEQPELPAALEAIYEVLLEINIDDNEPAELVLKWPVAGANPMYTFVERTTTGDGQGAVLAITPQPESQDNQTRFFITPPAYPRYGEAALSSPSPPYKLKVTVKRKS